MKHTAIGSGDVSCFLFILSILALLRNRKIYNNNDFYILAMHFAGIMLLDVETNIYIWECKFGGVCFEVYRF